MNMHGLDGRVHLRILLCSNIVSDEDLLHMWSIITASAVLCESAQWKLWPREMNLSRISRGLVLLHPSTMGRHPWSMHTAHRSLL